MLAYRHLFHAGNFADVFKHSLLTQLVLALEKKDKPFFVLDTHAGTGLYDLTHAWAQKNAEYKDGIALLWERKDVPNTLVPYLEAVRAETYGEPITVTTIAPGYIDTAINQDMKSRPFLIDVETGARTTADLIERGVGYATVPRFPWTVVAPLLRVLPTAWLVRGMPQRDRRPGTEPDAPR